ncbi:hypothetical protein C7S18_13925 [Ahniella affigens]|uniref:Novel STAND NTPase 1 domain-containing protein n=1 Tax=Ahniella affigens TaxID=2021234 RepID=A0A2P1PTS3_9GAMM|nr:hypothetical protein C7S18_13925 [Ahniella affigens]
MDQLRRALSEFVGNGANTVPLWEQAFRTNLRPKIQRCKPVLILDQFEEVLALLGDRGERLPKQSGKSRRHEVGELIHEIASIVDRRPLHADGDWSDCDWSPSELRFVIAIRSDYMAELDAWQKVMPSFMRNRFQLREMAGNKAVEAIIEAGRLSARPIVSEVVAERIVRNIANDEQGRLDGIVVSPAVLSVYCTQLNSDRLSTGSEVIAEGQLEGGCEDVLSRYYDACVDGICHPVQRAVEDSLIDRSGRYRESQSHHTLLERALTRAMESNERSDELERTLATHVELLINRRLLVSEFRGGTTRLELMHDLLVPLVAQSRDVHKAHDELIQKAAEYSRKLQEQERLNEATNALTLEAARRALGRAFEALERNDHGRYLASLEESLRTGQSLAVGDAARALFHSPSPRLIGACGVSGTLLHWRWVDDIVYAVVRQGAPVEIRLYLFSKTEELHHWVLPFGTEVLSAYIDQDGDRVMAVSRDGLVHEWSRASDNSVRVLATLELDRQSGGNAFIRSDRVLLAGSGQCVVADPFGVQSSVRIEAPDTAWTIESAKFAEQSDAVIVRYQSRESERGDAEIRFKSPYREERTWSGRPFVIYWVARTNRAWVSHAGELAVFAAESNKQVLWSFREPEPKKVRELSLAVITSAAFTVDDLMIVCGTEDGRTVLLDRLGEEQLQELAHHGGYPAAILPSVDGRQVAVWSEPRSEDSDCEFGVWSLASGFPVELEVERVSDDATGFLSADRRRVIIVGPSDPLRVISLDSMLDAGVSSRLGSGSDGSDDSGGLQVSLSIGTGSLLLHQVAASERWLRPGLDQLLLAVLGVAPDQARVVVTDRSAHAHARWVEQPENPSTLNRYDEEIMYLGLQPDGHRVATVGSNDVLRVLATDSGDDLTGPILSDSRAMAVWFSADLEQCVLLLDDESLWQWEFEKGELVSLCNEAGGPATIAKGLQRGFMPVAPWCDDSGNGASLRVLSPDGSYLVSANRSRVHLRHLFDRADVKTQQLTGELVAAAFSPVGNLVALACSDGLVRFWDWKSNSLRAHGIKYAERVRTIAFSLDGRHLLITLVRGGLKCIEIGGADVSGVDRDSYRDWLCKALRYVAGSYVNDDGRFIRVKEEERRQLCVDIDSAAAPTPDLMSAMRWHRTLPWRRSISPLLPRSLSLHIAAELMRLADATAAETGPSAEEPDRLACLKRLYKLDPGHPLILIGLLGHKSYSDRRHDWGSLILERLESAPEMLLFAAEMFYRQGDRASLAAIDRLAKASPELNPAEQARFAQLALWAVLGFGDRS